MNTHLEKAARKAAEMRAKGELVVSYNPAQKIANLSAAVGRYSAQQAIKAKCWECMGGTADEWDAGIRADIGNCTCGPESICPCPLYPFRPYQPKEAS